MDRISLSDLEKTEIEIPADVWKPGSNPFDRVVVGRILSGSRFNFNALKETMLTAFKPRKQIDFEKLDNGRFLLNFESPNDLDKVLEGGPWCYDNDLVILKLLLENDDPLSVPLWWVDFYVLAKGLPISKMTKDMASFIGNSLGQFRSVDLARNGVAGGSTLRIRVGLDVSKPLRRVSFFRAGSNNFNISYTYERLPNFCYICGIMGHIFQFCEAPNKDDFKKSDKEFPFGPSLRAPSRMSYPYRSMRRGSDAFSPHNENPSRSSLSTTWRKDSRPHDHQLPVRAQVQKLEGTKTHNAAHKQPISDCEMEGTFGASPPTYLNSLTVGSMVPMITSLVKIVSPGDKNQRPISPSHELDHTIDALGVHPVIARSVQSPTKETQAIQVIIQSPNPSASQRRLFNEPYGDGDLISETNAPPPSPILINIPLQFAMSPARHGHKSVSSRRKKGYSKKFTPKSLKRKMHDISPIPVEVLEPVQKRSHVISDRKETIEAWIRSCHVALKLAPKLPPIIATSFSSKTLRLSATMQALQSAALRPSPFDPLRKHHHSAAVPSSNAKPQSKKLNFTISASAATAAPKRETDPKKRVVITGMGLVSVFGNDVEAYYEKLLSGESGIAPIDRFDASKFPTRFGGQIRGFKSEGYIDGKNDRRLDDCLRYCIVAGKKALESADLGGEKLNTIDKIRGGVLVGTGMGGLTVFSDGVQALIEKGHRKITPFFIPYAITNMGSALLAIDLGLMGPNYSISTACATSNYCFYAAANHIRRGEADLMLAGGTEAAIIPIGLGGFVACRALSQRNDDPQTASRPWDKDRDGFVMGEGAGVLVMESLEHAMKRGAPIIAEYLGGAVNCDAYHMTDPRADGLGVSSCIHSALEDAGVSPEEVNYINAHATSTIVGDLAELNAIKKVFKNTSEIKINATKSMIGHCLGAAGGLEAIATVKAITTGWLHPTINQFNPEPSVEFDTVANKKQQHEVNVAISNSFGFGGHNSVVAFSAFKP
ncbi:hypothetical protein BUALT_Bualt18G0123700 [Buddleja alternifolia]|uniref:3-oxoacyl-[acyl-carrier-protein] synthase I, chloroplastic n=1 Tax=Buddleja alternifolia TaxID=168488 RepID=A0AAV6WF19_9LAMI|nr:hypothetical protein BUALT_Bualt18G0123700 [Buddleja alternifolia]